MFVILYVNILSKTFVNVYEVCLLIYKKEIMHYIMKDIFASV